MKIKAKKGYNIVLNDLKIALSSNGKIVEVDEEQFNTSMDAKQLSKFIEIVNDNDQTIDNVKSTINNLTANKIADQAFVMGSDNQTIENAVLMDPDNVIKHSVKKVAKLNDTTTVIQTEKNKIEEANAKTAEVKVTNINSMKVINTTNDTINDTINDATKVNSEQTEAKTVNTEIKVTDNTDNNSKQLVKKAKTDKKEIKNNKVEEMNKKDQNK